MRLIGVDVGGTFTDIVCTDTETGHTVIYKAPTTPDDPARGVLTGISELCQRFDLTRGEITHTGTLRSKRKAEGCVPPSAFRTAALHCQRYRETT
jgi:predicted NBD/HSP70 family sugar kinase